MNLTPAEQAALDSLTPASGFKVGTTIYRFETGDEHVLLTVPVPRGPGYQLGQRVTITFEETS